MWPNNPAVERDKAQRFFIGVKKDSWLSILNDYSTKVEANKLNPPMRAQIKMGAHIAQEGEVESERMPRAVFSEWASERLKIKKLHISYTLTGKQ